MFIVSWICFGPGLRKLLETERKFMLEWNDHAVCRKLDALPSPAPNVAVEDVRWFLMASFSCEMFV